MRRDVRGKKAVPHGGRLATTEVGPADLDRPATRRDLVPILETLARMDRKIDALGARRGEHAESAFRHAMRDILSARGVKVEVWRKRDVPGAVLGHSCDLEVDCLVTKGQPTLIEIKSSVSDGDVAKLLRIGALCSSATGRDPKLAFVCPFVTEPAYRLAKEKGIRIYTDVQYLWVS
ncbi:MAG: DUF3782 domain-containing protein [Nitrospirae bacterium]|nr:DUF3782 domain-containing protein [Nitrospirota bacterium]